MPTYSTFASVRDDFRCSLCRQKNTFHCEHDTPYRDQLLGTYDHEKPYPIPSSNRRGSDRNHLKSKNYTDSSQSNRPQNVHTGQYINPNDDPRHQHGKMDYNQSSIPVEYKSPPTKGNKKKDKSCIIL